MGWINLPQYRRKVFGYCEGHENSDSIKQGKVLKYLKKY